LAEPIKLQIATAHFTSITFRELEILSDFVDNEAMITKLRIAATTLAIPKSSPEQVDLRDEVVICWVVKKNAYFGHGSPVDRATGEYIVHEMNREYPDMCHWLEPANKLPFACKGSPLP
jgi:hypothetical protein